MEGRTDGLIYELMNLVFISRNVFGIFFNVPELEMKESVVLGLIGFGFSILIAFLLVLYSKGLICGGSQKVNGGGGGRRISKGKWFYSY